MRRGLQVKADAGLTKIELVILIIILVVIGVILAPGPHAGRCRSRHSASQAMLEDFSVALRLYKADFGEYPPEEPGQYITRGRKGSIIDLMSLPGPKGIPYYEFNVARINSKGQWVTLLDTPFKYRRNAGRPPAVPDPSRMMNVDSFDLWASGCGDGPACDAETSEPAAAATIRNW